jgi:exo-beta-1,3-glucanase (GH17 family)
MKRVEDVLYGLQVNTASGQRRAMSLGSFGVIVCLLAAPHLGFWVVKNPHATAPSVEEKLPSVSYNRFADSSSNDSKISEARIRADLTAIAARARAIRTYSSTRGLEQVPEIAAELGLNVTLGVWIDKNNARNEREISIALQLAHRYPNVTRLVVGNETMFRHEQTAASLAEIIRRVKRDSPVPVATADHWKFFLDNPQLVESLDQVFAHILPYWEGMPKESAVDGSIEIYGRLLKAFPDKKIVIGEFGWPSEGHNFEQAVADPISQAVILRNFAVRANARDIDYNIVEAIDQPEKLFEGNVGPYWGIFDASLRPKFAWTGPINDPNYWKTALVAVAIGLLLSLTVLALRGATIRQATLLSAVDPSMRALVHEPVRVLAVALPACGRDHFIRDRAPPLGFACASHTITGERNGESFVWLRTGAVAEGDPACARRTVAEDFDPYSGLSGAARNATPDHRFSGAARLPEFRMRRSHQQHPGPGFLATDRSAVP